MATPIIIPINNTKKVNCIIEDSVRYCEDQPMTQKDGIIIVSSIMGVIIYAALIIWLVEKYDNQAGKIFFAMLLLPFIVALLILL